jgi:hypothetical protein
MAIPGNLMLFSMLQRQNIEEREPNGSLSILPTKAPLKKPRCLFQ